MRSSEQAWAIGTSRRFSPEAAGKILAARGECFARLSPRRPKRYSYERKSDPDRNAAGRGSRDLSGAGAWASLAARVGQDLEYPPARAAQRARDLLDAAARRAQRQDLRASRRWLGQLDALATEHLGQLHGRARADHARQRVIGARAVWDVQARAAETGDLKGKDGLSQEKPLEYASNRTVRIRKVYAGTNFGFLPNIYVYVSTPYPPSPLKKKKE